MYITVKQVTNRRNTTWGEDQDVRGALCGRNPAKPQPSGGNTKFFGGLRLMLKPVHLFTQTWSFQTSQCLPLQSSGNFSGCLTQMFQVMINLLSWFHCTLSYLVFIDTPTFPTSAKHEAFSKNIYFSSNCLRFHSRPHYAHFQCVHKNSWMETHLDMRVVSIITTNTLLENRWRVP